MFNKIIIINFNIQRERERRSKCFLFPQTRISTMMMMRETLIRSHIYSDRSQMPVPVLWKKMTEHPTVQRLQKQSYKLYWNLMLPNRIILICMSVLCDDLRQNFRPIYQDAHADLNKSLLDQCDICMVCSAPTQLFLLLTSQNPNCKLF